LDARLAQRDDRDLGPREEPVRENEGDDDDKLGKNDQYLTVGAA